MSNCKIRIINVQNGEELNLSASNLKFDKNGNLVEEGKTSSKSSTKTDNDNLMQIAKLILSNDEIRNQFLELKSKTNNKKNSIKLGNNEFELPTTTAGQIFSGEDVELDGNFRILDTTRAKIFGESYKDAYVHTKSGDFIIMDSTNPEHRSKVLDFLTVKYKLKKESTLEIRNQLKEDESIKKYFKDIKTIKDNTIFPKTVEDLILYYIKNPSAFNNYLSQIKTVIQTAVKEILGKEIKKYNYTDDNANIIMEAVNFNPKFEKYSASAQSFFYTLYQIALKIKKEQEENVSESIDEIIKFGEKAKIGKQLTSLKDFKNNIEKWAQAILDEITDENFALSKPQFVKVDKNKFIITFENQYKTMDERFQNMNWTEITLYEGEQSYNGYTIYTDGDYYYIDKHILTTKSYGKRYSDIEEAKKAIDAKNQYTPLFKDESIALINRIQSRDTVWFPFKIQEGRVIKLKDTSTVKGIIFNFKKINYINNPIFFTDNKDYNLQYVKNIIKRKYNLSDEYIDKLKTAEDCYLFYAAADDVKANNISDKKWTKNAEKIIDAISKIKKYKYYQATDVSDGVFTQKTYGQNIYQTEDGKKIPMYKTLITEVSIDLKKIYSKDLVKNRFVEVVNNLHTIADALNKRFGKELVIVDSYDNLNKIEGLGTLIDRNTRGCIYNGIIYINSSTASSKDVFHEYVHLMLGILKANNIEAYMSIIEKMSEITKVKSLIYTMKQNEKYKYLSQTDITEEAVAETFGYFMVGKNIKEIEGDEKSMKLFAANIVEAANNIFTSVHKGSINDDIFNKGMQGIYELFVSFKPSVKDNHLFEIAKTNRIITNIIQEGIRENAKYKENNTSDNIRIEEECK